jgi:hypothetical protein
MALTEIPKELSSTPGIVDNSNATAITIDASENVGIGTSSPIGGNLHVAGSTDSTVRVEATSGNDASLFLTEVGTGNVGAQLVYDGGDNKLYFKVGNNTDLTRMTIDRDTGNVGIGTSSPDTMLELSANNNSAASNNTLRFTDTDTGTETNQQIGKIEFKSNDSSGDGALVRSYILSGSEDITPSSFISFATNPGGAGNATEERMRIDSLGNVGIGASSPATGIDVTTTNYTYSGTTYDIYGIIGLTNGGVRLGGDSSNSDSVIGTTGTGNMQFVTYDGSDWGSRMTLTNTGNVGIGTSSPSSTFRASIKGDYSSIIGGIEFDSGGGDKFTIGHASATSPSAILNVVEAANLVFKTSNTERMRIDASGNVGIGENNPSGLLHLTGDTNSNGAELFLQVNNNNTTDNLGAIHFGNNVDETLNTILGGTSGANNSSYLTFSTSNAGTLSEAARIDASGNLGIGTSNLKGSRAQATGAAASASPTLGSATDTSLLLTNSDVTYGINFGVINNGNGWIQQHSNTGTATAYNLLLQPVGGFVGIGRTSLSKTLEVEGTTSNYNTMLVADSASGTTGTGGGIGFQSDNGSGTSVLVAAVQGIKENITAGDQSGALVFAVKSPSPHTVDEAMRITSSGNLLVAKTDTNAQGRGLELRSEQIVIGKTTSGLVNGIFFAHDTSYVGGLNYTDTATSLITSSDERLKENIADADDAGSKIDAMQVRKIDWIADSSHQEYGFVAQELESVFSHAVHTAEDDTQTKGVDYASLVPMLVKEIQSLRARVAALEE